jgi:putative NADH-flavin reductase
VLGATGPSGICLLRELLSRKQKTIAYVRNSSKIPADLSGNALLEVRSFPPNHNHTWPP